MIASGLPGTHRATAAGWPRGLRPVGEHCSRRPARVALVAGLIARTVSTGARRGLRWGVGAELVRPLGAWLGRSARRRGRAGHCSLTHSVYLSLFILLCRRQEFSPYEMQQLLRRCEEECEIMRSRGNIYFVYVLATETGSFSHSKDLLASDSHSLREFASYVPRSASKSHSQYK